MQFQKHLILTEDGSHSIYIPELNENYHSIHGAVQESNHVFINAGLREIVKSKSDIHILEMGFGTGLNVFLTMIFTGNNQLKIHYTSLEAYPVDEEMILSLNYGDILENGAYGSYFKQIHESSWETWNRLSPCFELKKQHISLLDFMAEDNYDLVYFDAFAPDVQPELWTAEVFEKLCTCMNPGAILVTYCCKGP